jgi:ABC-type multidrug transport system ATPase subunit/pSer/pThr/pTyr-binding forkhead associated (FHA) protein
MPDRSISVPPTGLSQPFQIGRDPDCDLALSEGWVSRKHCCIGFEGGEFFIQDQNSLEGTTVNGNRVTSRQVLRDGDRISVGGVDLSVRRSFAEESTRTLPRETPSTVANAAIANAAFPNAAIAHAVLDSGLATDPLLQIELQSSQQLPIEPPAMAMAIPMAMTPPSMSPLGEPSTRKEPSPAWDATVVAGHRDVAPTAIAGEVLLLGRSILIGREADCGCRIDNPMVSRRHAELRHENGKYFFHDLGSANGSFLNGLRVTKPRALVPGDVISIASFRMTFNGEKLLPRASADGVRIFVRGLGKQVKNRETGEPLWLLRDIDLMIPPRRFIGLLGGSGCGKSTFMDAVNGRRPGTHGDVFYNGESLYQRFDSLKSLIGYVPQEVIFHEGLPLADALRYSAQLRLPSDTSKQEIDQNIERVLKTVGLLERRGTVVKNLSGGQKKRVSIAMELLSRPQVLFLDEVTSGLDLGTEQQMMQLFRTLADDGMTVICITHHLDSLVMVDQIAYFVKGQLGFFGSPGALKTHFGVHELREVYNAESAAPPEHWQKKYRSSEAQKIAAQSPDNFIEAPELVSPVPEVKTPGGAQFRVLLKRYINLLKGEYRNMLLLMALAPAVTTMLCILASSTGATENPVTPIEYARFAKEQNLLCFGSVIITLFLGLFASVREIVKEADILRHERFINLRMLPYLLSKVVPLAVIGFFVAAMVTLVAHYVGGLAAGGLGLQFFVLAMTSLAGTLMGLAISAAVPSSDWATLCMIGLVIPEILFSGALVPARGWSGVISKSLIVSYWGERALLGQLDDTTRRMIDDTMPAGQAFVSLFLVILHQSVMFGLALLFLLAKDTHGLLAKAASAAANRISQAVRRNGNRIKEAEKQTLVQ